MKRCRGRKNGHAGEGLLSSRVLHDPEPRRSGERGEAVRRWSTSGFASFQQLMGGCGRSYVAAGSSVKRMSVDSTNAGHFLRGYSYAKPVAAPSVVAVPADMEQGGPAQDEAGRAGSGGAGGESESGQRPGEGAEGPASDEAGVPGAGAVVDARAEVERGGCAGAPVVERLGGVDAVGFVACGGVHEEQQAGARGEVGAGEGEGAGGGAEPADQGRVQTQGLLDGGGGAPG